MSAKTASRPTSAIVRMALEQGLSIESALAPLRSALSLEACALLPEAGAASISTGTCAWIAPGELASAEVALPSAAAALTPREVALLRPMLTLQRSTSMVREVDVAPAINALQSARTVEEIIRTSADLMRAVERSHQSLFTAGLADACMAASRSIGFGEVAVSRVAANCIEVVAEDGAGRALISSIRLTDTEPLLETELVGGGNDGECLRVVDSFNDALARHGVAFAARPAAEPTGGRAVTESARAFLRIRPGSAAKTGTGARAVQQQAARQLRGLQGGGR